MNTTPTKNKTRSVKARQEPKHDLMPLYILDVNTAIKMLDLKDMSIAKNDAKTLEVMGISSDGYILAHIQFDVDSDKKTWHEYKKPSMTINPDGTYDSESALKLEDLIGKPKSPKYAEIPFITENAIILRKQEHEEYHKERARNQDKFWSYHDDPNYSSEKDFLTQPPTTGSMNPKKIHAGMNTIRAVCAEHYPDKDNSDIYFGNDYPWSSVMTRKLCLNGQAYGYGEVCGAYTHIINHDLLSKIIKYALGESYHMDFTIPRDAPAKFEIQTEVCKITLYVSGIRENRTLANIKPQADGSFSKQYE